MNNSGRITLQNRRFIKECHQITPPMPLPSPYLPDCTSANALPTSITQQPAQQSAQQPAQQPVQQPAQQPDQQSSQQYAQQSVEPPPIEQSAQLPQMPVLRRAPGRPPKALRNEKYLRNLRPRPTTTQD